MFNADYNPNLGYISANDIALLRVDHPFQFNPWVLPALVHMTTPVLGTSLLAADWGRTSTSSHAQSRFLKAVSTLHDLLSL